MSTEYPLVPLAATVCLIVFSLAFGFLKLRYFGFGFDGWLQRQIDYEERRKTALGQKAHRPLLVRHGESLLIALGWTLLPVVLIGIFLLGLYWRGLYHWVHIVAVPLAFAIYFVSSRIQQRLVPMYQANFDEYMALTAGDNCWFDGNVAERGEDFLSRGRIITVSRILKSGMMDPGIRLFVSYETDVAYLGLLQSASTARFFYQPAGRPIDGRLIGVQLVARRQLPDPGYDDLESRVVMN